MRWAGHMIVLFLALWPAVAAGETPARVVVLPFENLSGEEGAGREIAALVVAALPGRGYRLADPQNVEAVLEDERIRYLDSLTPPQMTHLTEATGASAVLLGSVYAYHDGSNPVVVVAARLVDARGRILWWDLTAQTAEDTVGVLGLGRVGTAPALARGVVLRLIGGMPRPGDSRGPGMIGEPVFLDGPIAWRSPYLPRDDTYAVAILPFEGSFASGSGAKIVATLLGRRLEGTGHFKVVEPALLRRALLDLGLRSIAGLDPDAQRRLGERLGAPYFVRGTLHAYQDGEGRSTRPPRVELTLTMVDSRRERMVWTAYHARTGDDYQGLLELGKVTTAAALADRVVGELVSASEASADPGQALKTVARPHPVESESRADGAQPGAAGEQPTRKVLKQLSPDEVAAARVHVQKGMAASEAGRDDEAITELTKAFEITADARLFFYLGSIYDRAGRTGEAMSAYRRFVTDVKVGVQQTAPVAKRIKVLEAQAAREEAERKAAPEKPAPDASAPAGDGASAPAPGNPPEGQPFAGPKEQVAEENAEAQPAAATGDRPEEQPAGSVATGPDRPVLTSRQERKLAERLAAATRAEKAKRHEQALSELRSAFLVSKDPELLGRMGRAADAAGRPEALELYGRYLAEAVVPAAARAEVELRLEALASPETPAARAAAARLTPSQARRLRERLDAAAGAERARKFDVALSELASAHLLSRDPTLLLAMARLQDSAGHPAEAAALYRRALVEGGVSAARRSEIEARAEALERQAKPGETAAPPAAPETRPAPPAAPPAAPETQPAPPRSSVGVIQKIAALGPARKPAPETPSPTQREPCRP